MTKPVLSVLIDTYNHERFIEQALVSAISQDFAASEYEILVVDDGSTDRTPEIVRKFGPRVRLIRKKNGGQASAFNAGFKEVRGDVVAFLDGDDWFAPGKLKTVMLALDRNPSLAGIAHGYYEFDEVKNETRAHISPHCQVLSLNTAATARDCQVALPCVLKGALTVRTKALRQCMPLPEELIFNADTPIAMATIAGGCLLLDKALYYYRIHGNNLYAGDGKDAASLRRKIEMTEAMYGATESVLRTMGVARDSISVVVDEAWIAVSEELLRTYGGSRVKTLQTEMRRFRYAHKEPSLPYRLFKYAFVGAPTLLLPARRFYALRDWYGRRNLGRLREQLVKSR